MKLCFVTTICTIASAMMAAAQVPSLINYQGRLTDAGGAPVIGSKNFSISIYDAATAGNLLYTETIGAVTLDANGVYSFRFGGSGTSNTEVTETVATTNGTGATFQRVLANSPVVAGSVSVTDGTYTWSPSAGSSNEDDFGVAYSTSLRRVTVNYYNDPPVAGRTITATYRYGTSGITGALSSGGEHWMAVSVDGVMQETRQRVLAVPFATRAGNADVATKLAPQIKTELLQLWTQSNNFNPLKVFPMTTPGGYTDGVSSLAFKILDSGVSVIHSLAAETTIASPPDLYYPPFARITLVSYGETGLRTVVGDATRATSGTLILNGPFNLDRSKKAYVIECEVFTGVQSNRFNGGPVTINPVVMKFEN
jgi:hypothetical protein